MSGEESPLPDLGALLSRLGEVQQGLQQAQESAAAQIVEGTAGGGAVRVRVSGGLNFESVTIDPSVIDAGDVGMLEDLVLAAVRDAVERAHALAEDVLGGLGFGGGLGGLLGP